MPFLLPPPHSCWFHWCKIMCVNKSLGECLWQDSFIKAWSTQRQKSDAFFPPPLTCLLVSLVQNNVSEQPTKTQMLTMALIDLKVSFLSAVSINLNHPLAKYSLLLDLQRPEMSLNVHLCWGNALLISLLLGQSWFVFLTSDFKALYLLHLGGCSKLPVSLDWLGEKAIAKFSYCLKHL